ncbi:uncharacterized protein [Clytia hemisphaerica]|uniref:Ubiquitin-like protease family profile domain-containing protein n=1 Tax=Clytia hemisphaerica TaxID=252671 RepID=A0A7M5UM74_9CNID|eukprot:TCONS_00020193-protein
MINSGESQVNENHHQPGHQPNRNLPTQNIPINPAERGNSFHQNGPVSIINNNTTSTQQSSATPSRTPEATSSLKKLGRKKKLESPALMTHPVMVPSSANNSHVIVKNRFKHIKPTSIVGTTVTANSVEPKPKNALQALAESYVDEPPAKQMRTESPSTSTLQSLQQKVKSQQIILQHATATAQRQRLLQQTTPAVSLTICPNCRRPDTLSVDKGTVKCNNCNRSYVSLNNTTVSMLPQTFYSPTPHSVVSQRLAATNSSSPSKNLRGAKKPTETIDLISSDEEEEEEESDESTNKNDEHSSTTQTRDNTTVSCNNTEATTSTNSTTVRKTDQMRLKGGEIPNNNNTGNATSADRSASTPSPSPAQNTTNKYIFNSENAMFGELYGKAVMPIKVTDNRMYLSLECHIYRDNVATTEKYTLSVGSNDVSQVYVYFGRVPSFVAIETARKFATVACKRIGKEVLCPGSSIPERRYIILALKNAFKNDAEADLERQNLIAAVTPWARVELLSHADAIQLISQAKLEVNQTEVCYGNAAKLNGPIETILVYPSSLKSGGIPITNLDVECLDEGTYLNDIIIDFYLKYICETLMTPEQREKTYIFNSYFYKRLTQKASNKTDPAQIHAQVKKWTRNVDIFQKDYIIIPINEHCHWYLAIVCFHGRQPVHLENAENDEEEDDDQIENSFLMQKTTGTEGMEGSEDEEAPQIANSPDPSSDADAAVSTTNQNTDQSSDQLSTNPLPVNALATLPSEDLQNAPMLPPADASTANGAINPVLTPANGVEPPKVVKEVPKQAYDLEPFERPCILIFDSLVGSGHSRVFTNLRNYLSQEWLSRKSSLEPKVFNKDTMKGCYPKIPRQNNDCDCGVFLLQYAEFFFSKPIRSFRMPVNLQTWFTVQSVTQKRTDIKTLIHKLAEDYQHSITELKASKPKTKKKTVPSSSSTT